MEKWSSMKMSISISDQQAKHLAGLASAHKTNVSTIIEAAIKAFRVAGESEQEKVVRQTIFEKRSLTRNGWRAAFWDLLADEFGVEDFARGNTDQILVPRTYNGCYVVFLLNRVTAVETEGDPLIVHMWQMPGGTNNVFTKHYSREDSVFVAARETADWIRRYAEKP
jgi:hypothetical protein